MERRLEENKGLCILSTASAVDDKTTVCQIAHVVGYADLAREYAEKKYEMACWAKVKLNVSVWM